MRRLILLAITLAGCLAVPALSATAKPVRVLYIGDSLSHGAAATDYPHSFPWLVTAGLERRGQMVTQLIVAKGGVRTAYWQAAAIPKNINVAIVELGTNDAHEVPAPEQFSIDYQHLITMIRAKSPHAKIVCLSVWRPDNPPAAISYDETIKADCPGRYVDINRFAQAPNLSSKDGFHPNNAGHASIATAVLRALNH